MIGAYPVTWPASTARAVRRGYRLVCKKAVRIGLIHGSGDDDRSGQYRSPQPFPIALSAQPGGQAVMIALLLASVWYWAVIINKVILLRKLKTGI